MQCENGRRLWPERATACATISSMNTAPLGILTNRMKKKNGNLPEIGLLLATALRKMASSKLWSFTKRKTVIHYTNAIYQDLSHWVQLRKLSFQTNYSVNTVTSKTKWKHLSSQMVGD